MKFVLFIASVLIASNADARLYEVRLDGQTSYLMGLHPGSSSAPRTALFRPLVQRSCQLLLLSDPSTLPDAVAITHDQYYGGQGYLRKLLSPTALGVARRLLRDYPGGIDQVLDYRAGAAAQQFRVEFIRVRDEVVDRYVSEFRRGVAAISKVELDPRLVNQAALLFGTSDRHRLMPWISSGLLHTDPYYVGITTEMERFLRDTFPGRPDFLEPVVDWVASAEHTSASDLDRMLRAFGKFMDSHDSNWFWNRQLGLMLMEMLNVKYLALTPDEFGWRRDAILRALPTDALYFPGEETRRRADLNRHSAWTNRIHAAVASGGAFVAVPADHVVPGLNGVVGATLVDELRDRGAVVNEIPLTSDSLQPAR